MATSLKDKETLNIAEKTLLEYKLCDHCIGRLFAKVETGLTNKKRGQLIRSYLKKYKKTEMKNCWLCFGLCDEIPHFADLISDSLNDYDYETFLVGTKVDEDIITREQELFDFAGSKYAESIKTELNREIGKILEKNLKKKVDFEKPTITAVVDTSFDVVNLQISSLFVYGRYKKYRRDIPQTRWFCRICRGKGCKRCEYIGKLYETSVEELVAKKFLDATRSDDESFHGCGREDVDVRMLGNGRPFTLEIKNPRIRKLDLAKLESNINTINKDNIEISDLRFSNREETTRLKDARLRKTYRIVFRGTKLINIEKLKKVAQTLQGKTIGQLTPSRVAHRRANMVREKHIYNCSVESVDGPMATLILEAESGTYIKELVSGDDGRTNPSISRMIGVPCEVAGLDVIKIKGEG
jgi:tRNA pseudouridine synthase 10